MRKKLIRKIITRILETVVLCLGIGLLLLQTPWVQTKLAQKATQMAEKHLDADIHFSSIKFAPFNTLIVKDFALIDRHPMCEIDTVMSAKHVSATFTLKGLLAKKGGVHINRLRTEDFNLYLVIYDKNERGYKNNISSIFNGSTEKSDEIKDIPDLFSIKRADVKNFHYRMVNISSTNYRYRGHGINWADLEVWADARGHDINFVDSRCGFYVDWVKAHEKCGYSFWGTGYAITGHGLTEVLNTHIVDQWSDIRIKSYTMAYTKESDWQKFLYKIRLGGDVSAAPLSLQTVGIYSGIFKDCPILLDVDELKVDGPVNSMDITSARFKDRYSGVDADLSVDYDNLFDITQGSVDIQSRKFRFTTLGLGKFISALIPGKDIDLSGYARDMKANLTGRINGTPEDMQAALDLASNIGGARLSADAKNLLGKDTPLSYTAEVDLNKVDLGKAGLGDKFGPTTLSLHSHGDIAKGGDLNIELDKLSVDRLTVNGYAYSQIDGNGYFRDNTFTGNIRSNDPSLNFILGGSFSLSNKSKNSIYKFNLALPYADLVAMNIDRRPGTSTLSTAVNLSFRKNENQILIGDATISRLTYTDQAGSHNIGDILFASVLDRDKIRINLRSAFADITYSGDADLTTLAQPILSNSIGQALPSLLTSLKQSEPGRNFDAQVIIKDTKEVLSFLRKDILITHGTQANVSMAPSGEITGAFTSHGFRLQGNIFRELDAQIHSQDSTITMDAHINEIKAKSSGLKKAHLNLKANDDKTCLQVSAADILNKDITLLLDLDSSISRDEEGQLTIDASLEDSFLNLSGDVWTCSHPEVIYKDGLVSIDGLRLFHDGQSIELNGAASKRIPSRLSLNVRDVDISTANLFLKGDITLGGMLNGYVNFDTPASTNLGLETNLTCSALTIGKTDAGQVSLNAYLDDEDDLLKFSLINSSAAGQNAIKAEGTYNSLSKYLNARATFNDFNPGVAQKAVAAYCSSLDGHINGKISAVGPVSDLTIRSNDLSISDMKLTLVPTGVSYTVNANARYDQDGVVIDNMEIADKTNGRGHLSGRLDKLSLHLDRLRVLDKASGDYNGTLALNGDVVFSAKDPSHLTLDANLANAGDGKVNIVLANKNAKNSQILQFKEADIEQEDELEQKFTINTPSGKSQLDINGTLAVNPGLELNAYLDREGSNALNIKGDGVITADMNSKTGALSLGGNYNITEGKYHFSAIGALISKDFNIQDGSYLNFAGDLMDTELNISAIHSLKTSLGVLISDTTSVATRRLVNCGIKISDKLRNPQLAFSIDIPDLDPTTKALVDSELNTEDKVSRQFLALVVLGGFVSGDQNGVVNNNSSSTFLYSNLASIMSGQLNNILEKFNIPLDFGLSYQQNNIGNNEMDVAVSTQLFDNMVSVNGSVGNRNFSSTSSGENVVGDLDINIKLNKSGHFRLNLFSHSADDYTNYLDNTQRNGVGITYQIEYNNLRSFFRSLFRKDKNSVEYVPTKKITIENE